MYTGGDYDEASRESNWQVLADFFLEIHSWNPLDPSSNALPRKSARKKIVSQYILDIAVRHCRINATRHVIYWVWLEKQFSIHSFALESEPRFHPLFRL